ncbi:MAG: threonine--tRNA ligase [Candidatus Zixiibacteriota bacterium]|jgi:threonyl-tRNA synthetase
MTQLQINVEGHDPVKVDAGATLLDVARAAKAEDALVARRGDRLVDLSSPAEDGEAVAILDYGDTDAREILRHTASHLLAHALTELYPGTKLALGPATADGFYYDFDSPETISDEDLPKIEARMAEIAAADFPISREEITKAEARELFADNPYKLELIEEIPGDVVIVYQHEGFVDLCLGPHLPSTGYVKALRLTAVAGAYWRGDERNEMLTRIYGTAYREEAELEAHLARMEEAKRRDHRTLGRDLGLFSIAEERGAGLVYWHPAGAFVRDRIETFWKEEHKRRGYQLVTTPHLARARLFETSGHFQYFLDNMYTFEVDGVPYVLKPMNCPGHVAIYRSTVHSYRELPIRYAELGTVYRKERSGTLHGLLRVRGFTVDDGHIFCTPDQLVDELCGCVDLALFLLHSFGFENYRVELSARDPEKPDEYAGTAEEWAEAEAALAETLSRMDIPFERMEGEAVFYGPKIDIQIIDALGRKWQGPTVQFDFNLPPRFGVKYVGSDGSEHQCYMIHRAMLGSFERFFGTLLEHYAGVFPPWLAPVQMRLIPVNDDLAEYAAEVAAEFRVSGLRAEVDESDGKLGAKIRAGEMAKVPYLGIIGKRERDARAVSVRAHGGEDMGAVPLDRLIPAFKKANDEKAAAIELDGGDSEA